VSAPQADRVWRYHVHAGPGARELSVHAELPAGVPAVLGVDDFAHPFLRDLEVATERGWQTVGRTGRRWLVPRCRERGCYLRYTYRLGEAAERIDRFAYAGYRASALMAPPSTFLLAPQDYSGSDLYRARIDTAPGESFVSGVYRDASTGALMAPARVLFQAPYSGFGRFERETLHVGASAIELALAPDHERLRVTRPGLRGALARAAAAVQRYYGRFPVPQVTLIVLPTPGAGIMGMQLGNGGASIVLFLGEDADDATLARDWVLVHELLHLGVPTLEREHSWIAEGLATYQEPLVRARAGLIGEPDVWRAFLRGMPQGLPAGADGGLDGSERWGRTYWGGALVFLLLDLELRTRTHGRISLDDAAREILRRGGDTMVRWSLRQTLRAGDSALDRASLSASYDRFAFTPVAVDLGALFQRLGVRMAGDEVLFDERAELAGVRRALVARARPL